MSTNKNKRLKTNQRKKRFIAGIILLISCCIVLTLLMIVKLPVSQPTYSIENRVDKIKEKQKNDKQEYITKAWLRVQGTNIDLPVLSFANKTATPGVEYGDYAWDERNDQQLVKHIEIQGHNIMNLSSKPQINKKHFSRFDDLMSFVYYDFAKENKYFQYTIDGQEYLYKIFSVSFENSYNVSISKKGQITNEEMQEIVTDYKDNSIYNYDVDVNGKDKVISLTTCTWFFGTNKYVTFVVAGRLVREDEKINNYEVEKSKEYKKVEEILKGEPIDEEV